MSRSPINEGRNSPNRQRATTVELTPVHQRASRRLRGDSPEFGPLSFTPRETRTTDAATTTSQVYGRLRTRAQLKGSWNRASLPTEQASTQTPQDVSTAAAACSGEKEDAGTTSTGEKRPSGVKQAVPCGPWRRCHMWRDAVTDELVQDRGSAAINDAPFPPDLPVTG
ncbi:hypothetical protein HPB50_008878 [Hyalomma asiaticum]|uniref:Uncharacterized protein n=1 Tax=Hyalomma asiaticum TaxID=266040 RepID=A0ACB7TJI7_HYAAI|nr:hypothetical protein HPB50_008878 [Hyalomma asiaticum]